MTAGTFSPIAPLLAQMAECVPQAFALAEQAGNTPLGEYSRLMRSYSRGAGKGYAQDGADLLDVIAQEAAKRLPPELGKALSRTLEEEFCALTANHLGIDFHPEFIQGAVVFALHSLARSAACVPALAWGLSPLDNMCFPRGLLFGRGGPRSSKPIKLPILSNKNRKASVAFHPGFSREGVLRAMSALDSPLFTPKEKTGAATLLREVFLDSGILSHTRYRDQAPLLNRRIWEYMFTPEVNMPPLAVLDLSTIARRLVRKDIADPCSLFNALLAPESLQNLIGALEGVRGCWTQNGRPGLLGTFLFWKIRPNGTLEPLWPKEDFSAIVSGDGSYRVSLTPKGLDKALEAREIVPGLYASFTAISLARGFCCCGGVYQAGYIPMMREATASVLRRMGEETLAAKVAGAPASPLNTCFLPLHCADEENGAGTYAASPVDIVSLGGLDAAEIEAVGAMPVNQAFAAALAYRYEDLIPARLRAPGWFDALRGQGNGIIIRPKKTEL